MEQMKRACLDSGKGCWRRADGECFEHVAGGIGRTGIALVRMVVRDVDEAPVRIDVRKRVDERDLPCCEQHEREKQP